MKLSLLLLLLLQLTTQLFSQSINELKKAAAADPDNIELKLALGTTYMDEEKFAEAAVVFREAIKKQPESWMAHGCLGDTLSSQEKWAEAVPAYRDALVYKPDWTEASLGLSAALLELKDYAAAEKTAKDGLLTVSDESLTPLLHKALGSVHEAQVHYDQAVAAYEAGLALMPDPETAVGLKLAVANCHIQSNAHAKALPAARDAVKIAEADGAEHLIVGAHTMAFVACLGMGDFAAAKTEAEAVKKLHPEMYKDMQQSLAEARKEAEAAQPQKSGKKKGK